MTSHEPPDPSRSDPSHLRPSRSDPSRSEEGRTAAEEARTDAAVREVAARGLWSPPAHVPPHLPGPTPAVPPAPRARSVWRSVGIGALGLLGGVLLALIAQDVLATVMLRDGAIPLAIGLVFASLMPACAVLGVVVALLIDGHNTRRRARAPRP